MNSTYITKHLIIGLLKKQLVLLFRESRCVPKRSRGKHRDSRENKTISLGTRDEVHDVHFAFSKKLLIKNRMSKRVEKKVYHVEKIKKVNLKGYY